MIYVLNFENYDASVFIWNIFLHDSDSEPIGDKHELEEAVVTHEYQFLLKDDDSECTYLNMELISLYDQDPCLPIDSIVILCHKKSNFDGSNRLNVIPLTESSGSINKITFKDSWVGTSSSPVDIYAIRFSFSCGGMFILQGSAKTGQLWLNFLDSGILKEQVNAAGKTLKAIIPIEANLLWEKSNIKKIQSSNFNLLFDEIGRRLILIEEFKQISIISLARNCNNTSFVESLSLSVDQVMGNETANHRSNLILKQFLSPNGKHLRTIFTDSSIHSLCLESGNERFISSKLKSSKFTLPSSMITDCFFDSKTDSIYWTNRMMSPASRSVIKGIDFTEYSPEECCCPQSSNLEKGELVNLEGAFERSRNNFSATLVAPMSKTLSASSKSKGDKPFTRPIKSSGYGKVKSLPPFFNLSKQKPPKDSKSAEMKQTVKEPFRKKQKVHDEGTAVMNCLEFKTRKNGNVLVSAGSDGTIGIVKGNTTRVFGPFTESVPAFVLDYFHCKSSSGSARKSEQWSKFFTLTANIQGQVAVNSFLMGRTNDLCEHGKTLYAGALPRTKTINSNTSNYWREFEDFPSKYWKFHVSRRGSKDEKLCSSIDSSFILAASVNSSLALYKATAELWECAKSEEEFLFGNTKTTPNSPFKLIQWTDTEYEIQCHHLFDSCFLTATGSVAGIDIWDCGADRKKPAGHWNCNCIGDSGRRISQIARSSDGCLYALAAGTRKVPSSRASIFQIDPNSKTESILIRNVKNIFKSSSQLRPRSLCALENDKIGLLCEDAIGVRSSVVFWDLRMTNQVYHLHQQTERNLSKFGKISSVNQEGSVIRLGHESGWIEEIEFPKK